MALICGKVISSTRIAAFIPSVITLRVLKDLVTAATAVFQGLAELVSRQLLKDTQIG